ncbi:MAG: class I SAM-dependent methyltransferase [bacterium]|nr:class I SAM-dependent methyltransferase [bacterium]
MIFQNDSFCSQKECKNNLLVNGFKSKDVQFIHPDEVPEGKIDFIVLKIPKSLNYLEYLLQNISLIFPPGLPVIAADMAKNIHSSTVSLFEHYLEDVKTSLAWKKARLVLGETGGKVGNLKNFPVTYKPSDENFELVNYPNVFAHGRLDPGAAFMLSHFPYVNKKDKIIDLACGDGILAVKAAFQWPDAKILCLDESYLAVKSAEASFVRNGIEERAGYQVGDSLEGVEKDSTDVVFCNPPFHNSHSLSTSTAIKMFHESYSVLKPGGELFIVANRHLSYEKQLSKIFGKVQIIKSNKKFSIIRGVK